MARRREYRSCYSCDHSEIQETANGRIIICHKSVRLYKPKSGESFPDWCKLKYEKKMEMGI